METSIKRFTKLAVVFLVIAAVIGAVAFGAYLLFFQGYRQGLPTMHAQKMDMKQMFCFHDWSARNGICTKCGLRCAHPRYNDNFNCVVCGFNHKHTFIDGVCSECGTPCPHEHWSKGICTDCGYECTHPEWHDDVCTTCGMFCLHSEYKNGFCTQCGLPCPHAVWENGKCKSCGKVCDHEDHNRNTGICNVCGTKVYHDFSTGVCSCGLTPPFVYQNVKDNMLAESAHKGRISTVTYTTKKYNLDNAEITKNMDIYLPYGYNQNKKYDVLVVLHDAGENYTTWSSKSVTVGSNMTSPRNLYDNMIDMVLCRPMIIVSLTTNYRVEGGSTNSGYKQMAPEIRNDILPYVAQNYSTYARGGSAKAISEARDHFGIMGFGEGATYAYRCGMIENFDLFSNFACFGGGPDADLYVESVNSDDNITMPIRSLFCGAGTKDPHRVDVYNNYYSLTNASNWLQPGVNSWYIETSGDAGVITDFALLYDALMVLFPQIPEQAE